MFSDQHFKLLQRYCSKYLLKNSFWIWRSWNIIKARLYALTLHIFKLIRKMFIFSKYFHVVLWLIENWKLWSCDKNRIMIIGLTTSCEIIWIEITNSRKYTRIPIILSMISFTICVLCIFQYGHFIFVLSWKDQTWPKTLTKILRFILTSFSKIIQIEATDYG